MSDANYVDLALGGLGGRRSTMERTNDFLERVKRRLRQLIVEEEGGLRDLVTTGQAGQRKLFRKLTRQMAGMAAMLGVSGDSLTADWMRQQIDLIAESSPEARFDANHHRMFRILTEKLHVGHEELVPQTVEILVAHGITDWTSLTAEPSGSHGDDGGSYHSYHYKVLLSWGIHGAHAQRIVDYAAIAMAPGNPLRKVDYDWNKYTGRTMHDRTDPKMHPRDW